MDLAYAAYTEAGTFLLDEDGVCRWVVAPSPYSEVSYDAEVATKCIGAQYVASLNLDGEDGGLSSKPRLGTPMLFAKVGPDGRIFLVRTAPVIRFEETRDAAFEAVPHSSVQPTFAQQRVVDADIFSIPTAPPPRNDTHAEPRLPALPPAAASTFRPPPSSAPQKRVAAIPPASSRRLPPSSAPPPMRSSGARWTVIPPPPRSPQIEPDNPTVPYPRAAEPGRGRHSG